VSNLEFAFYFVSFMIIWHLRIYVLEVLDSQCDASPGEEFAQTVLNPNGGGAEHNDPAEWAVNSSTCDVLIFMCSGGVRWILVMLHTCDVRRVIFVMLHTYDVWCDDLFDDMWYWIVIYVESHYLFMCMLQFLCAYFGGSPAGEADKIGNFFKKKSYVPWFT
jgi:hypothetical protein